MANKIIKLAYLGLPLLAVSCSKSVVDDVENPVETKIVRLSLTEEQTTVTEDPLLRAPALAKGNDEGRVYAVNVYSKAAGAKSYTKYAYGLFDDPSKMNIALQTGSTYRFECSETRDDQESVYHDADGYWAPFRHGGVPTPLENQFVHSSTHNFEYLVEGSRQGWVSISATDSTRCPRIYRYYALVDDFDPSQSETIDVELRRAVFGLHLIIEPPTDGSVSLNYLTRNLTISAGDAVYDHEAVYSYNQISRACAEGYSGDYTFELVWMRADGTKVEKSTTVTLKRNVMTTLHIRLEGRTPSGFQLSEEETEMGSESKDWVVKDD